MLVKSGVSWSFSIALGVVLCCLAAWAGPVEWEKDFDAALDRSSRQGKPIMVWIWSPG